MIRPLVLLVGAVVLIGAVTADGTAAAAVLAVAVVVLVLVRERDRGRIEALEDTLDRLMAGAARRAAEAAAPPPDAAASEPTPVADDRPAVAEAPPVLAPPRRAPEADRPAQRPPRRPRVERPAVPARSLLDDLPPPLQRVWAFATGGNPLARVGALVLFVGFGLLIRYAADLGLLSIQVRLGLAALAGVAMVALGWRLRAGTPGVGLTLQGGGVAVLYLTIYAAYALYALVPSLPAIVLMGVVAVACGGLAVVQNAPGLAVLGVAGGFAAPVLAGTAEGNHVLLLGYYALLNVGVLGAAWARGWRSVALVGFASTFLTGGLWGGLQYTSALYASVQPFVVVSFAVYLALAVRFAVRTARAGATPERALVVDGALVFGLPAATFVLQDALVDGVFPYGRAWSAAALAAVYLVGAAALWRRDGLKLLADAFLAIGLAFATLALPLAFERVVFGAIWVLEGAGLVWVGARQQKAWMRAAGLALQGGAAAVLFAEGVLWSSGSFSSESLTGWIVAVGLGLSADVVRRLYAGGEGILQGDTLQGVPTEGTTGTTAAAPVPAPEAGGAGRGDAAAWAPAERLAGRAFLAFALLWWTLTAAVHVLDLVPDRLVLAALLAAAAGSALLFLGLGRALRWPALAAAALGLAPVGGLLWLWGLVDGGADAGRLVGWVALVGVAALALKEARASRFRIWAYVGTVWLTVAVVARELVAALEGVAEAWPMAAVGATLAAGLALALRPPAGWVSVRERRVSVLGLVAAVGIWTLLSWGLDGRATPLPTVPPLDPLTLASVAGLIGLWAARSALPAVAGGLAATVGALGFGALTVAVLRAVAVFGGVVYDVEPLYASSTVQAALAVVWTVLALVLTVAGSRRGSRALWFAGVGVLAVVVAKLFLVDLTQTRELVRVGAFLTVGVLGLLMSYVAPLPPRVGEEGEEGG